MSVRKCKCVDMQPCDSEAAYLLSHLCQNLIQYWRHVWTELLNRRQVLRKNTYFQVKNYNVLTPHCHRGIYLESHRPDITLQYLDTVVPRVRKLHGEQREQGGTKGIDICPVIHPCFGSSGLLWCQKLKVVL